MHNLKILDKEASPVSVIQRCSLWHTFIKGDLMMMHLTVTADLILPSRSCKGILFLIRKVYRNRYILLKEFCKRNFQGARNQCALTLRKRLEKLGEPCVLAEQQSSDDFSFHSATRTRTNPIQVWLPLWKGSLECLLYFRFERHARCSQWRFISVGHFHLFATTTTSFNLWSQ